MPSVLQAGSRDKQVGMIQIPDAVACQVQPWKHPGLHHLFDQETLSSALLVTCMLVWHNQIEVIFSESLLSNGHYFEAAEHLVRPLCQAIEEWQNAIDTPLRSVITFFHKVWIVPFGDSSEPEIITVLLCCKSRNPRKKAPIVWLRILKV